MVVSDVAPVAPHDSDRVLDQIKRNGGVMGGENVLVTRFQRGALAGAIASLLCAGAGPVQAQGDSAPEEITVTGTRLRRTDGMAEPVPVTTLTTEELARFRARQHGRRAARRAAAVLPDDDGAARRPGVVRHLAAAAT